VDNDKLDEVNKELENNLGNQWNNAHEQYDNGKTEMLENLYNLKANIHELDTKKQLDKKANSLDYDKFDTFLIGLITTAFTYLFHPIIFTAWIGLGAKILYDSKDKLSKDNNVWQKLDEFGFELAYYIAGTLLAIYFFTSLQAEYIIWSKAGTLATIVLEVIRFAGI